MKHAWYGATETTTALRAYLRTATTLCALELHDLVLPGLGYPNKLALRWVDFDRDIVFPSPDTETTTLVTYASGTHVNGAGLAEPSPRMHRGSRKEVIGVEVDSLDLSMFLDGTEQVPAADGDGATPRLSVRSAIRTGIFDGVHYTLRRLFLAQPPVYPIGPTSIANRGDLGPGDTSLGAVTLFAGLLTEAAVSRSRASLTVRSALEKLSVGMPWRLVQPSCPYEVYDSMCGASRTGTGPDGFNFQATGRISSHAPLFPLTQLLVTDAYPANSALTQPLGFFEGGTVQFTSGALAGLTFTVERPVAYGLWPVDVTEVVIRKPLPIAPAPGDQVLLQKGCRKILDACRDDFGNFVDATEEDITFDGDAYSNVRVNGLRFGGCPRVPPPDSAV